MFEEEVRRVKADIAQEAVKRETLRNLDCFVLDNSIRESTVGQLRGHTLENKWKVYEEVKKCGFNNIVVASFAHMTRVDDLSTWSKAVKTGALCLHSRKRPQVLRME